MESKKKTQKGDSGWVCWLDIMCDLEIHGKKFDTGAADEKKYLQIVEQKNEWLV